MLCLFQAADHSYSCALERSFLYHGRMYVSAWHICFHSNVFSKQMKVSFLSLVFIREFDFTCIKIFSKLLFLACCSTYPWGKG